MLLQFETDYGEPTWDFGTKWNQQGVRGGRKCLKRWCRGTETYRFAATDPLQDLAL